MEVLVLDGKNYVKASKAARNLGYATDYVGQLCRSGKVDAHLIGRTWYVNEEMLSTHKVEKKRISRVKAREYAKKTIEEHRVKINQEKNISKNIAIRYESDTEDLIPKTKKLSVESLPVVDPRVRQNYEEYDNEVVNKGDKVLMSGDLEVVDVTDGPIDTETVFLTPGRIRRSPLVDLEKEKVVAPTQDISEEEPIRNEVPLQLHEEVEPDEDVESESNIESPAESEETTPSAKPISFTERLDRLNRIEKTQTEELDTDPRAEKETEYETPTLITAKSEGDPNTPTKSSVLPYVLFQTVLVIIVALSIGFSYTINYDGFHAEKTKSRLLFTPAKTIDLLKTVIEEKRSI